MGAHIDGLKDGLLLDILLKPSQPLVYRKGKRWTHRAARAFVIFSQERKHSKASTVVPLAFVFRMFRYGRRSFR